MRGIKPGDPVPVIKWFDVKMNPLSSIAMVALNPNERDSTGMTRMTVAHVDGYPREVAESKKNGNLGTSAYMSNSKQIRYKINHISRFYFSTDAFNIDIYGNTDLIKGLFITGDMGQQRIGDMLPLDYLP